jgi:hypothetical protein
MVLSTLTPEHPARRLPLPMPKQYTPEQGSVPRSRRGFRIAAFKQRKPAEISYGADSATLTGNQRSDRSRGSGPRRSDETEISACFTSGV